MRRTSKQGGRCQHGSVRSNVRGVSFRMFCELHSDASSSFCCFSSRDAMVVVAQGGSSDGDHQVMILERRDWLPAGTQVMEIRCFRVNEWITEVESHALGRRFQASGRKGHSPTRNNNRNMFHRQHSNKAGNSCLRSLHQHPIWLHILGGLFLDSALSRHHMARIRVFRAVWFASINKKMSSVSNRLSS